MLLCSNATIITLRCCAHAVGKIAMSVTETHQNSSAARAARPTSTMLMDDLSQHLRPETAGDFPCLSNAYCRSWNLKIFVTFCDKDGQAHSIA